MVKEVGPQGRVFPIMASNVSVGLKDLSLAISSDSGLADGLIYSCITIANVAPTTAAVAHSITL